MPIFLHHLMAWPLRTRRRTPLSISSFIFVSFTVSRSSWLLAFLCAAAAGFAFSRALERRGLSRRNAFLFVACSLCTSYPLFFNAWVGNTEIALTVVLGLGLFFFLIRWSWLAAMCFGVAAALKIYPLIFLALLLGRKQYRQLVFALAVYMTVNIASMWLICGSVETAWRGIQGGLAYYQQHYVLGFASSDIAIDHSLFGFIKSSIVILGLNHPSTTTLANILRVFLLVAGCVAILLYFLRIRKLPITNQILCLVVITLTFSPGSKEFTLMNLYVPWGLLALTAVTAYRRKQTVDGLAAAFICLLLLLVPLTEVLIRGNSLNGQLKTVILLALLVIGLKYPFSEVEEPRLPQTSLVSQEA